MKLLRFALFLMLAAPLHADGNWRVFTAADGRTMEAEVVRVLSDSVVVVLKSNGREATIPFLRLSDEDVQFLKSYTPPAKSSGSRTAGDDGDPADDGGDGEAGPDGEPKVGRLYPKTRQEINSTVKEIQRRPAPKGISKDVQKAVNLLNVYRYLCGVPHDVKADAGFSKNSEDAAKACKEHGSLSHGLGRSTDKCNLSTAGDMAASVANYIEDSGENNREARGHRAWCLNAPMGKAGFGSAGGSYSAMWCMDRSGKGIKGTWAYPGKGLFPLEYLHGNAWSFYGGENPGSANKVKVEIHKLSKRPERPFTAGADIPGRSIPVEYVSLGMNGAVNFEPAQPVKRGIYWVRISGGGLREGYLVELY